MLHFFLLSFIFLFPHPFSLIRQTVIMSEMHILPPDKTTLSPGSPHILSFRRAIYTGKLSKLLHLKTLPIQITDHHLALILLTSPCPADSLLSLSCIFHPLRGLLTSNPAPPSWSWQKQLQTSVQGSSRQPGFDLEGQVIQSILIHDKGFIQKVLSHLKRNNHTILQFQEGSEICEWIDEWMHKLMNVTSFSVKH